MEKKNHDKQNLERLCSDLQSADELVRARAVNSLCPCQVGWELFEQHRARLSRLMKDPNPMVRTHAQHVFEDAAKMHREEDVEYRFQTVEEKLGRKLRGRAGTNGDKVGVRRSGSYKRRRGGFVLR